MRRSIGILGAMCALAGCSRNDTPPSPSSFDLPGDVAFACMVHDRGDGSPAFVALSQCRLEDEADDPETHSLIALVTQVATGEVAAVDLREERSLDSSPLVPGFTYVQVGEIPTGIATIEPSATAPSVTFVSNFGSRTIQGIDTARFHPDVPNFEPDPLVPDDQEFAESSVDLPEGPADLVFVPVTAPGLLGYVFAPLPASGTVAQVPVTATGRLDGSQLQLLALDPDPANALATPAIDEVAPYERVCPTAPGYATAGAPFVSPAATTVRPIKLEVDTDSNPPVLLVADEVAPVIHRFQVVAAAPATPLQGIGVGVPTIDVAATPFVASQFGDDPASASLRYLYAIDATDGSVLAVDYTPTSATFGALLAVNVGPERSDRIAYREPARAIEVITPELRSSNTPGLCEASNLDRAEEANPFTLRGVFLSVGFDNGTVGIVDVWDLDAPCRGGDAFCANPALDGDVEVAIRRHRPRIGTLVEDQPVVTGSPALSFETNPGLLDDSGRPTSGTGPGLAPIDCPQTLGASSLQGFPNPDDAATFPTALVCLRDDPWAGLSQRYTATFDGTIPLASGGDGLLVDAGGGALRFEAPNARFCDVGVLGGADVVASALGPDDPEASYGGDQLEIVGDLPPDTEGLEECEPFDLPNDGTVEDRDEIVFQILEARPNELVLAPLQGTDAALALRCFPHKTSYRVRTRGVYLVAGTGGVLAHRVIDAGGACRVDTATYPVVPGDPDSYRNFRAFPQRTFIHPLVAFQITRAGSAQDQDVVRGQTSQLVFDVALYPAKLAVDLGTVPVISAMSWNPIDDRLYVVDEGQFRVNQIDTDAFGISNIFD